MEFLPCLRKIISNLEKSMIKINWHQISLIFNSIYLKEMNRHCVDANISNESLFYKDKYFKSKVSIKQYFIEICSKVILRKQCCITKSLSSSSKSKHTSLLSTSKWIDPFAVLISFISKILVLLSFMIELSNKFVAICFESFYKF